MSLINQMLQDLEKRRASAADWGAVPNQVRVLPRPETNRMTWWLLGAALACLVALVWTQVRPGFVVSESPVATRQTPLQSTPATVPERTMPTSGRAEPAFRLALELERIPQNVPASTPPVAPAAEERLTRNPSHAQLATADEKTLQQRRNERAPSLRPEAKAKAAESTSAAPTIPSALPSPNPAASPPPKTTVSAADAQPQPASIKPSPAGAVPRTERAADQTAAAKSATVPAVEPQIDKQTRQLTPQQQAENDYRRGAELLSQGRLAEAQEGFFAALKHDPVHTGARQGLFGVLLDAKKNAEAEQVLGEGLRLNPNQPGFAMALARLQVDRGATSTAIETLQKSAAAGQASPDYSAFLAALLQRQSRHSEAVEQYQAALRLAPGSGIWLMGLGISLQAINRNAEATEAYRRAKATNTLTPELQAFVDQRLRQLQ